VLTPAVAGGVVLARGGAARTADVRADTAVA
jgi:hypothetical protein